MMKPQKVQALTVLGQMHDSGLAHLGRQPQVREQPNQMRERILGLPTAPAHDHHIVGVTHQNPVLTNIPHPINPVQIHIRQHRSQDSSNAVGNFCFEVSLSYRRVELPRRVGGTP